MNDERLARFLERGENKYWGKYRGFVEDRNDAEKLGRLKLKVPSVLGDAITGWAWPAMPYAGANLGFFFLPQRGDLVWVEFIEGELEHPVWSGGAWGKPGGTPEIPDEAKSNYPDTQVLKTKSGHVVILEDKAGSEMITVRAKSGCEITIDPNKDLITVTADQSVTVTATHVTLQSPSEQAQPLATRDFVKKLFDAHVHPSGVGPTGPPTQLSDTLPTALTSCLEGE
jgi:uncharacterized protein involved in type VI secretion and phage assembly